jgi:hypothetical protein
VPVTQAVPFSIAKSRRDYLAQVKMLTVDERTQEAAKINKALGIKAPKGSHRGNPRLREGH